MFVGFRQVMLDSFNKFALATLLAGVCVLPPSVAVSKMAVCTDFEVLSSENLERLAGFFGLEKSGIYINDEVSEATDIGQIRIYFSPPISAEVISCVDVLGIPKSSIVKKISEVSNKLGREEEVFPGGPMGEVLQTSQDAIVDDFSVRVSASRAAEPLRSIVAMTSILGIDDTSCVRDSECIQAMENP